MTARMGGARQVRGRFYARVRLEKGRRVTVGLPTCSTMAEAEERAGEIAEVAAQFVAVGRWFDVEKFAKAIAAAADARALRVIRLAVAKQIATSPTVASKDETFAAFAARWTNGELARDYPDHVPVKDARGDVGILAKHINPIIGHIPLVAFVDAEQADSVMRLLPSELGTARRRHVAQVIHRVLRLAAFPAKVIKLSPLPKGWLPKLGKGKALTYLYPDEDAKLLASPAVEFPYRLLYGFLAREGMRLSEALAMSWADLDLDRGSVNLDENKTDDPRAWALDASVVEALRRWKPAAPKAGPFAAIKQRHVAERLRSDLKAAGVDRPALFASTDKRRPLRAHDLRATFITLALANGRTESWVQDRTGHTSTLMIARYRRVSRTAAELSLGALAPLADALPELRGGAIVGQHMPKSRGKKSAKMFRDSSVVAPSGLEPEHSSEPEILKPQHVPSSHAKPRQNAGSGPLSQGLASTDPQGDPPPTRSSPSWRSVAEVYEVFVAENLDSDADDDRGPAPLPTGKVVAS